MELYRHRQIGIPILVALGTFAAFGIWHGVRAPGGFPVVLMFVVGVMLACMLLFWALFVQVTTRAVHVWFGPGLLRRRFLLDDILKVRVVRNRWYYGWGIRLTPTGWMFNISGLDAVELEFEGGRTFRIGTDQPLQLAAAIQDAMDRPR